MKSSKVKSIVNTDAGPVSRRDVLSRGAQVLSLLALPEFMVRKAWGQTATTFDYYVSLAGSDSNPGTLSSPWAITSLHDTNANNAKMAGKRIGIIAGTYNVASMRSGSNPNDYTYPTLNIPPGTSSAPTYVASCNSNGNYSRGAAIFLYSASSGVNAVFGQNPNRAGYCTLDGVEVNAGGYNGSPVAFYGASAGSLAGLTIQNCEIHSVLGTINGDNYAGLFLGNCGGAIIRNNYLHDIHKPVQADHCHGYEEYSCVGNQFIFNTVANCDTGVDVKLGDSGTTIANNYFYNCPIAAIQGCDGAEGNPNSPGTPYNVHHNVIDSCGYQHLTDINGEAFQGLNWYNNTCLDTRSGSFTTLDLRSGVSKVVRCYNNINVMTANTAGPSTGSIALSPNGYSILDYNDYSLTVYASAWGLSSSSRTTFDSLSTWQSATGAEAHSITSNPQFTSKIVPGAGPTQFQLSGSSPCNGAGRAGGVSTGSACDMGAWANGVTQIGHNFQSGAPVPNAPTLNVS